MARYGGIYKFHCVTSCGQETFERFAVDAKIGEITCPRCGGAASRQAVVRKSAGSNFDTPIEMFSIALDNDDEIREFRQKAPDVQVNSDPRHPDYGLPIARNRHQKLQALKAAGYEERK